jgi:glycosyltransferase involved in cell wall biosynthesis
MKKLSSLFTVIIEHLIYRYYQLYWSLIRNKYHAQRQNKSKPRLLFGSTPIINNKLWAYAMAKAGYESKSITFTVPKINSKGDFDIFFNDIYKIDSTAGSVKQLIQACKVFTFVAKNYDILFTNFRYQFLSQTRFWKKEAFLFKYFGIKTLVLPYGNDFYMFSKIIDHSVKHNLFISSPLEVCNEEAINERAIYWRNMADFMTMSVMLDGAQRWDAISVSELPIDIEEWKPRKEINTADGKTGVVRIVHTPNHRGLKGTEFIVRAFNELKEEGLKIELILIENKQNSEVKRILHEEADILAEQLIMTGYGLSGIEGMASGLAVMSNFERADITEVFRRYSFLNECPILSSTPENVKENLRLLITQPKLRRELSVASREYVEKYHSYDACKYLYEQIIDKIWFKKPLDTLNLYHPLKPDSFNNQSAIIKHPLIENKLPHDYFTKTKNS